MARRCPLGRAAGVLSADLTIYFGAVEAAKEVGGDEAPSVFFGF